MCDSIIYLIGFSGTGKTTIGKKISDMLDIPFLDMDSKIEEIANQSVSSIFRDLGENQFRKMETDLLKSVSNLYLEDCRYSQVVSTGGGVSSIVENLEIMSRSGILICLSASPETILMRLNEQQNNEGNDADRPMLHSKEDPLDRIKELLKIRHEDYMKADFIIDTDLKNPLDIAIEIVNLLK